MSLGTLKRINVIIAGHAQFPGNYVVSPSISIINLLIKAGGVSSAGTLEDALLIEITLILIQSIYTPY